MIETIEILEGTSSNCCNSIIHVRHSENGDNKMSDPFCSKCGKFPKATLDNLNNAKNELINLKNKNMCKIESIAFANFIKKDYDIGYMIDEIVFILYGTEQMYNEEQLYEEFIKIWKNPYFHPET